MNYKPLIPYYQAQWMLAGKRSGSGAPSNVHLLNTLIVYWTLDEASGTRADSVGTMSLNPSGAPVGVSGKINNGCQLVAASSQFLTHADTVLLRVTSDFTFSAWVKLTSQASIGYVFSKNKNPEGFTDYVLVYDSTHGFYFAAGTALSFSDAAVSNAPVSNGVWTHVVCWYDSVAARSNLRINNATTYVSTTNPGLTQNAGAFFIGCIDGGSGSGVNFIDAVIDEVGFWKRLLTAEEITALYNGGAGLPYSSFTA